MVRVGTVFLFLGVLLEAQQPQVGSSKSAVVPFRMPPSIGLSLPSIGLSGPSIGVTNPQSRLPAPPAFHPGPDVAPVPGRPVSRGRGRRGVYPLPFGFVGAPLLLAPNDTFDPNAPVDVPEEVAPADNALGEQVRQLSAQIADLQNQIGQKSAAPLPPVIPDTASPAAPGPLTDMPQTPPVVVVLRNGKTIEVHSYAVMGDTFWDLSSQPTRKIAIGAIDVPASSKASEAKGSEFPQIAGARSAGLAQ